MTDLKFEDSLARLEQIVIRLESGTLPLEESLRSFEEGIALARRCAKYLEEAERRIEILTKDEAGAPGTKPFSWGPRRGRRAASAPQGTSKSVLRWAMRRPCPPLRRAAYHPPP